MMRRAFLTAALALFTLLSTLLIVHAQAQTNAGIPVEFSGTVQSANATALVINGLLIDISAAQVNAPLVAGQVVRVRATLAADGSLSAIQVDPVAPGLIPGLVVINGFIEQIDGSTVIVNGLRISTLGAQIEGTLNVGSLVILYAEQTAPNVWTARFVTGVRLGGPIVPAVTPEVGASPTLDIAAPAVTPEVGAPLSTPEVLAPNATPEVAAPASTPEVRSGEDFDIRGTLDSFSDAEVVVDGRRFFIGGAEIDGRLVPGAQVRLEIRVVNGQWVLEEIKVEDSRGSSGGNSGSSGSDDNRGGNSGSGGSGNSGSNSGSGGGNSGSGSGGNSGSGGGGNSGSGGGSDDSGGGDD